MRKEGYQRGQKVLYEEDGGSCVAKVLKNNCRPGWEDYKLKVVEQLVEPHFSNAAKPGKVFNFTRNLHEGGYGLVGRIVGLAKDPGARAMTVMVPPAITK